MGLGKRGRPKLIYPAFDTFVFESASCPCKGFSCGHRTLLHTCERPGGGRLYRTVSKWVCVDVLIKTPQEHDERKAVTGSGDGSRGMGLAPPKRWEI